ncbi:MAG: hypothetical protein Q8P41_22455 [Pseudomonadota bacterium]|nr:hypothetical protein [Pseudomonadota bacterium]
MRLLLFTLSLAACSEYEVKGDTPEPPGVDTSVPDCPPTLPDCADTDTAVDTEDSVPPVDPDDCEVAAEPAGLVTILEECQGTGSSGTVTDPYNLEIEYQYTTGGSGPVVKTSIINLTDDDGNGRVDTDDIPDIVFTVYTSNQLIALNGDGSGEIFVASGWHGAGDVATADVDADGDVEICGFSASNHVQCADATGTVLWTSTGTVSNGYPHITVCDIDQDGKPEVIGDSLVVNGEDGTTEFTISTATSYSVPVCADIDQDGTSEIILGANVWDHNGNLEWSMSSGASSAMAAVVNADGDDNAEVFLASDNLYLYDDDGTLLNATPIPTTTPGPPCAADFDGDGEVEIAVPSGTAFYMFDTDGSMLWQSRMQDNSGLAGCSGYDMDGDGIYEVLFADEVAVRLYDGATGAVLYESFAHNSGTLFEYPVIADVDKDGSAEIIIAENLGALTGITVYGHAGDGWPASGPTWPVHDFAVTNIDPDGSVPVTPEASWLKYNVFRARPAVDDPSSSDLFGDVTDICVADCDNGPIKIAVQVSNQGATDIVAGTPWTFYRNDGGTLTYVTSGTLPAVPMGTSAASFEIEVAPADLGVNGFIIGLDDDGAGVNASAECDGENNLVVWGDRVCG